MKISITLFSTIKNFDLTDDIIQKIYWKYNTSPRKLSNFLKKVNRGVSLSLPCAEADKTTLPPFWRDKKVMHQSVRNFYEFEFMWIEFAKDFYLNPSKKIVDFTTVHGYLYFDVNISETKTHRKEVYYSITFSRKLNFDYTMKQIQSLREKAPILYTFKSFTFNIDLPDHTLASDPIYKNHGFSFKGKALTREVVDEIYNSYKNQGALLLANFIEKIDGSSAYKNFFDYRRYSSYELEFILIDLAKDFYLKPSKELITLSGSMSFDYDISETKTKQKRVEYCINLSKEHGLENTLDQIQKIRHAERPGYKDWILTHYDMKAFSPSTPCI